MNDLDRQLGTLFSDIARFRRTLFDQLASEYDLTQVQVLVLNQLHKQDGLTQKELSDRMGLGTVSVSGLIDRLEAKGYVERHPDTQDRRAKRVWLTSKVEDLWKRIAVSLRQLNDATFQEIDSNDIDHLITILRKARRNLQNHLSESSK